MKFPAITAVVNAHAEKPQWLARAIQSAKTQVGAPECEIILVCDAVTKEISDWLDATELGDVHIEHIACRDLGTARNFAASIAKGKYISYLDGDDLWGYLWLKQAYEYAENMPHQRFFLHPELNIFFGKEQMMHRHVSDDSPQFDAKGMVQYNEYSALAFAPLALIKEFPYMRAEHGLAYEDWCANVRTMGAGVNHRCVPKSAHMLRLKLDQTSLAARSGAKNGVIPRMELFDRRDLPNATAQPPERAAISDEQVKQIVFAHREIGERQLVLDPSMTIRQYPRQRCWDDQAFVRDGIGDAAHVVLVNELVRGGAEKYAIDWAAALQDAGEKVCIVETTPGESVWLKKAAAKGVRVVRWFKQSNISQDEQLYALQRALIQCELKSLFVCNSNLGWGLVHSNAECLAEKVFAASFATIPMGMGFEMCPPFWIKEHAPNLTIITDNDAHAKKLRDYNGALVTVIHPKCDYAGPSKRSQIDKKHIRVLWAGRGTPEKNPEILPALAKELEGVADIHVWGDVAPMNGPENLKYRGPFDGFEAIDGSYDVYLLTSINEGMPNTAMEAVLAGLPVVGPSVGGIPDIASQTFAAMNLPTITKAIYMATSDVPVPLEINVGSPRAIVCRWRDAYGPTVASLVTGRASPLLVALADSGVVGSVAEFEKLHEAQQASAR